MGALKNIRKASRLAVGGGTHEHGEYSGTPHGAAACRRTSCESPTCRMRKGRTLPTAYFLKNVQLRGSTLIETMIASLIFLCVFTISLETVSRLTVKESDGLVLVEANYRIKECFREYGDGRHEYGQYAKEYDWGTVTVLIRPYGDYADLQEVTITALIENISKRLEFKHIIETSSE